MIRALRAGLVFAATLAVGLAPAVAQARCGDVGPPSYADIEAIMLEQNGCGSSLHAPVVSPSWQNVSSFACSTYWVFFWNNGRHEVPTAYSQFSLRGSIGTFQSAATLNDARAILEKNQFFSLTPPDYRITDTAHSVLSVKRCAVVTRISIYNDTLPQFEDPPTKRLFDELRSLVENSQLTKESSTPQEFGETGLFDP